MLTFSSPGGATVLLNTSKKSVFVVMDDEGAPKATADLTVLPHPEEVPTDGVISWPGEYDIGGVSLRGIGHDQGSQVSFALETEGVRCAFISCPLREWTDKEMEHLGEIDILVIPAGEPKLVQKMIEDIDPRVLIPLPAGDAKNFNEVLKTCGAAGKETVTEWKLKGGLPTEGREVVVFSR